MSCAISQKQSQGPLQLDLYTSYNFCFYNKNSSPQKLICRTSHKVLPQKPMNQPAHVLQESSKFIISTPLKKTSYHYHFAAEKKNKLLVFQPDLGIVPTFAQGPSALQAFRHAILHGAGSLSWGPTRWPPFFALNDCVEFVNSGLSSIQDSLVNRLS